MISEHDDEGNVIVLDLRASLKGGALERLARRVGVDARIAEMILRMMIHGPAEDREFFVGWVNREHLSVLRREKRRADERARAIELARLRAERDEAKV